LPYVAGIDIGSAASKSVVFDGDHVIASHIIETGPGSRESAEEVFAGCLTNAGLESDNIRCVVATGYGRINVPFADKVITEIACHARGVHYHFPNARTILDMGGQDCKAIRVDEMGRHVSFAR
jgi:(R)-2-hydroxyacyl-CoA dehydratese activating ATPase